jgi:hypothetical protein
VGRSLSRDHKLCLVNFLLESTSSLGIKLISHTHWATLYLDIYFASVDAKPKHHWLEILLCQNL